MLRPSPGSPAELLSAEQSDPRAGHFTPQLIAALLASAQRALPSSVLEAEQYILRASQLLLARVDAATPQPRHPGPAPLAPWLVGRVERWIEAHLGEAIRIEQLAAVANLSRSHFSRAFHRATGDSPLAYVRRRRIALAQQLMLTTRRSLAQIALDCGLADQCHLTRVFRRVAGITPAQWRRLQRNAG